VTALPACCCRYFGVPKWLWMSGVPSENIRFGKRKGLSTGLKKPSKLYRVSNTEVIINQNLTYEFNYNFFVCFGIETGSFTVQSYH
jgi:hypothetical protein